MLNYEKNVNPSKHFVLNQGKKAIITEHLFSNDKMLMVKYEKYGLSQATSAVGSYLCIFMALSAVIFRYLYLDIMRYETKAAL